MKEEVADQTHLLDLDAAKTITDVLRDEGYRAKLAPDGGIVTGVGGFNATIHVFRNSSLQFSLSVQIGEERFFSSENANDFNSNYRFGKVFVDEDGDVNLTSDFLLDATRETAASDLGQIMQIFDGMVSLLREAVSKAAAEAAAAKSAIRKPALRSRKVPATPIPKPS